MAAAFGLSRADALKAVTLYPARIMGGDLLEIRSHLRYLFIDGRPVVLTSRHTELNDAFKNRK